MKKKIEKLNINLFPESTNESVYKKEKFEFIAKAETYIPGGFLLGGYFKPDPARGKADWDLKYPEGYLSWKHLQAELNALGEQNVIDKINEIIDYISKK